MMTLKRNGIQTKVMSIVSDVNFPISKSSLIEFARSASDGDDVIDILNQLEKNMYETEEDARDEIQNIISKKEEKKGKKRHVIGDDEQIYTR